MHWISSLFLDYAIELLFSPFQFKHFRDLCFFSHSSFYFRGKFQLLSLFSFNSHLWVARSNFTQSLFHWKSSCTQHYLFPAKGHTWCSITWLSQNILIWKRPAKIIKYSSWVPHTVIKSTTLPLLASFSNQLS